MNNIINRNSEYETITHKSHNSVIKNQITSDTKYVFVGTNTQYHIEQEDNKEDYSPASGYYYGGVKTSVYEIIDELCGLNKEDSLVLKKELLCKKLDLLLSSFTDDFGLSVTSVVSSTAILVLLGLEEEGLFSLTSWVL